MVSGGITGRLRASCLSRWELGDLLGIHPHQLAHLGPGGLSARLSIEALIELSRRLDIHPADLVADLDTVLANRRLAPEPPKHADRNDTGHGHHGDGEQHRPGQLEGEADALVALTALAHARTPLRVEDLARALRWPLGRVHSALDYAQQHQRAAGPLSLRRVPPETFTVSARLDILTAAQHHAIQSTSSWSGILAQNEALVLLAALAYGSGPRYATFRDNDHYRYAEEALKRAGILYSDHGPHHAEVSDDVLYSLRYRDDTHIANERGEHTIPATR